MFKSRRKRQQQKLAEEAEAAAAAAAATNVIETPSKYQLLDDIQVAHDFRSSVILPQLNKDLDPNKMTRQQQHLQQLQNDGTKQYQELAAWRHQRSQNRYSNGLFGGKQRGRPKPNQIKKIVENEHEPTDFLPPQESYAPEDSDEENYFFQDFSTTEKPVKKSSSRSNRRHPAPTAGKFDLSSFARDLHDHRLSVIQPRESRIIMTEDDELELEKLLLRQRQRMSMMTINNESMDSIPPPLPSLDLFKSHQLPALKNTSAIKSIPAELSVLQDIRKEPLEHDKLQHQTPVQVPPMHTAPPSRTPSIRPLASLSETRISAHTQDTKRHSPSAHTAPKRTTPPPPSRTPSVRPLASVSESATRTSTMQNQEKKTHSPPPSRTPSIRPLASLSESSSISVPKFDPVKRSISTTSIRSNATTSTTRTRTRLTPIHDIESRQAARKSISMDNLKLVDDNEPSVTSAALDWINGDATQDPTSFLYRKAATPQLAEVAPKRSLFGSLRQVSRSKTHAGHGGVTSIKGLVRNFSSSHKQDPGMSRAAMAVIQHNAKTEEPRSTTATKSDANLISNLISRASSGRTKVVNMEDAAKKKRAQVVRRTIIYVQPDSLHDMLKNNGGVPPPVPSMPSRNTVLSDHSLDDDTKEYVTATKIVRQTSVRKRVVDTNQPSAVSRETSGKRYQLKSVDEHALLNDAKHSSSSGSSENSDYLEGVELREMSDGTVVWGLVKKGGSSTLDKEEERIPGSPPPIPKRSPRRQETNVYYSDQDTLPHLLKMMQGQHPGDEEDAYEFDQRAMTSVDDQLDEMMRILTSPQH
ncbi:uncharacterized protein EV154DRAFT_422065 [Mucor mucedo]|uniref:uncharacterized protein n=1 Tax=Mucor mucedo TaxID=29922 RepID=UPI00221ED4D8|nr:uncharacterized protein EV154DRAFT_422065 [Mucor mucedo]KAI7890394.1 hypothetical protein EV154DRAFT_422065 [Mucor mucedo]